MKTKYFEEIVAEINLRAKGYRIGKLQEIRKKLKNSKRLMPGIFAKQTIFGEERYAFHVGGRTELQFNIGIENINGKDELRFGVAFSFALSRSLSKIEILVPKVKLFNNFIQLNPKEYDDMKMWHYTKLGRSSDYMPTTISSDLVAKDIFVFLGQRQDILKIDYDLILKHLDRLLLIYEYVESKGNLFKIQDSPERLFQFRSGYTVDKASTAKISLIQKELDANLRHNILQSALCKRLSKKYGAKNIGAENPSGIGKIDVVVQQNNEYWFYEIKTEHSPRVCIRQALGQLLEYAFWANSQNVTRLIIVGETALDKEGEKYLLTLIKKFSLPIEYEHIKI